MTELEQRLTNELSDLAEQYAEDQKRLAGQVERLEEQVRELAGHYEQERKAHIELMSLIDVHIEHVGKLTDNYKALTDDLTELWQ